MRLALAVAGFVGCLGLAVVSKGDGYSRVYPVPTSGVVSVVNDQANSSWRPVVVAFTAANAACRTVEVSRIAGALVYPIATQASTGTVFVYEFSGAYWSGVSNGFRLAVSPACTGKLEVVYE